MAAAQLPAGLGGIRQSLLDQIPPGAGARAVVIDREVLGGDRLLDLWAGFLPDSRLPVHEARVGDAEPDGTFTVTGKMRLLGFDALDVSLVLFPAPSGDTVEAVLAVGVAVTSWAPADQLTDLPPSLDPATGLPMPSFLQDLRLPEVRFALSSYDFRLDDADQPAIAATATMVGRPLAPGLNFGAAFDPAPHGWLDMIRPVAGWATETDLHGVVEVGDGESYLHLHLPLGPGAAVSLGATRLELDEVVVDSGLSPDSGLPPEVSLLAHLTTTAGDFPLVLQTTVGESSIRVVGGDEEHRLPLDDVALALGVAATDLAPGIDQPSMLGDVALTHLELEADLSPPSVDAARVVLTTRTPWPLLGGRVTFEPRVEIAVHDPHGTPETDLHLLGRWMVGGSLVRVGYSPTSGAFAAELEPDSHLDVGALLGSLLPGHPVIHVAVPAVRIWGDATDESFSVELTAAEALRFRCGPGELRLDDLRFFAAHDATGDRWELQGLLHLAGAGLLVAARHGAGGWDIDARGVVDSPIDLGALTNALLAEFHADGHPWPSTLPEGYARLTVRELVVRYAESDGSMSVYVDLETDATLLHEITFTHLTVSLEFDSGGFARASVAAAVEIAGVELDLETTDDAEHGLVLGGHLAHGQAIAVDRLLPDLSGIVGTRVDLPAVVDGMQVTELALSYAPASGDVTARLRGGMPGLDDAELDLALDLSHRKDGSVSIREITVGGQLTIGNLTFAIDFGHDPARTQIVASLTGDAAGALDLHDLASAISARLSAQVPAGVGFEIDEIVFIHEQGGPPQAGRPAQPGQSVLVAALRSSIDLAALPLVGTMVRDPLEVSIEPLILAESASRADLARLATHLPDGPIRLPDADLVAGVHLESHLRAGSTDYRLGLPIAAGPSGAIRPGAAAAGDADPSAATTDDGTTWFRLDRAFGPVRLSRVGMRFEGGELSAILDGGLSLAGLTLELIDLSVSTALDPIAPTFSLRGVAIDYRNGDAQIGGTFLRTTITPARGPSHDEFAGRVVISTSSFSLTALGLYAPSDGDPSLFLYGVLREPIGGPAFFFVTGLAVGVGYNRELVTPPIGEVADFPLVREATGELAPKDSLREEMAQLGDAIRPVDGSMFLAAGVMFNSFKLIDSFVLIVVQAGRELEVDVLGLATAIVPTPVPGVPQPPLAEIQLAISARFAPNEGVLAVRAQLTSASYVYSHRCRLSGGFAVNAWFGESAYAGEFVTTLGGYHPHFRIPAHYPRVPRLALSWPVDDHLSVAGNAYFALTGSAVMAGAHLSADYRNGALSASFHAGIDMLLAWKPYHYEAQLHVSIDASYTYEIFGTHHLSLSVSADLEVWGPEFAGRATIDLGVTSVSVRFGPRTRTTVSPIDYGTFAASFLPEPAQMCAVTIVSGLVATVTEHGDEYWLVHPKDALITVQSAVPVNDPARPRVAVGPVGVSGSDLSSELSVTIHGDDENAFAIEPLHRGVPAALWGAKLTPGANDPATLDAQVGFEIRPSDTPEASATAPLQPGDLAYDTALHRDWAGWPAVTPSGRLTRWTAAEWETGLGDVAVARRRRGIARSLGFSDREAAGPRQDLLDDLLADPAVLMGPPVAVPHGGA